MSDSLRLEQARQRVRIAELEAKVARLVQIISSTAAARAMREEVRRGKAIDRKYAAIATLASCLGVGCIETLAARIERVFAGQRPIPEGTETAVEFLRREYSRGGPSRQTIRRALTELPNQCVNASAAENAGIYLNQGA